MYVLAIAFGIFEDEIDTHLKTTTDGCAFVVPSRGESPLLDGADGRCFEVALRIRLLDGRFHDTSINIYYKLQYDKSIDAASACIFWISWYRMVYENRRKFERLAVW